MQTGSASPLLSSLSDPVLSYPYRRSDHEVFSLCPHRPRQSRQCHRQASLVHPPNSPEGTRVYLWWARYGPGQWMTRTVPRTWPTFPHLQQRVQALVGASSPSE